MQRVTVLCVGKLKEKFYIDAAAEYVKRLQRHCKLELIEQAQKAGSCLRNDPANSAHMPMGIPIYFTIVTSLCSTSR